MNVPPLDFRPYAGQCLIVGEVISEDVLRPQAQRRWYILGPWTKGEDLPAHVKAIILDDAEEASELLYVAQVADNGRVSAFGPLVVLDDQGYLRYGVEFLTAIVETGIGAIGAVARGIHFEDEPTP
jgi:hypothetical protein